MAKVTVCILLLVAFFWGTEALPLGATDILVGVLLYLFTILPINEISRAYMKDAVFFIFGILAVAVGVAKTGLDKRIGLILLCQIKNAKAFAFIFLPLLSLPAGFFSEHALVALLIPVLMGVYKVTCKMHGVKKDRALAIFLLLGVCFAANHGGPGSPAAAMPSWSAIWPTTACLSVSWSG
jgi:sodium-dependent dicarboxylate transporter 2/3/5